MSDVRTILEDLPVRLPPGDVLDKLHAYKRDSKDPWIPLHMHDIALQWGLKTVAKYDSSTIVPLPWVLGCMDFQVAPKFLTPFRIVCLCMDSTCPVEYSRTPVVSEKGDMEFLESNYDCEWVSVDAQITSWPASHAFRVLPTGGLCSLWLLVDSQEINEFDLMKAVCGEYFMPYTFFKGILNMPSYTRKLGGIPKHFYRKPACLWSRLLSLPPTKRIKLEPDWWDTTRILFESWPHSLLYKEKIHFLVLQNMDATFTIEGNTVYINSIPCLTHPT